MNDDHIARLVDIEIGHAVAAAYPEPATDLLSRCFPWIGAAFALFTVVTSTLAVAVVTLT